MLEYGRNQFITTGRDVMVIADGDFSKFKSGGISLSPTNVASYPVSNTANLTLTDDTQVVPGQQYMRFGQVLTKITDTNNADVGKFAPYDPNASNGLQTLTRGECFILNRTWLGPTGYGLPGLQADAHPAVFDTGRVWKERILMLNATTGASVAAGPLQSSVLTAFPGLSFVEN